MYISYFTTLNDAHPIRIYSLNSMAQSSMQQPITSLYSYDWQVFLPPVWNGLIPFWPRNIKVTDRCLHFCYSYVLVTVLGVQQYKQVNWEKHIDLFPLFPVDTVHTAMLNGVIEKLYNEYVL